MSRPVARRLRYLPREVFFGRLGFAGVFFTGWADDFGRFLPATSDSFLVCSASMRTLPQQVTRSSAIRRGIQAPWGSLRLGVSAYRQ